MIVCEHCVMCMHAVCIRICVCVSCVCGGNCSACVGAYVRMCSCGVSCTVWGVFAYECSTSLHEHSDSHFCVVHVCIHMFGYIAACIHQIRPENCQYVCSCVYMVT